MKKQCIYETFVDLVECNLFRNNHITQDVWLSNCCAVAYVAQLAKKFRDSYCRFNELQTTVSTDCFVKCSTILDNVLQVTGFESSPY